MLSMRVKAQQKMARGTKFPSRAPQPVSGRFNLPVGRLIHAGYRSEPANDNGNVSVNWPTLSVTPANKLSAASERVISGTNTSFVAGAYKFTVSNEDAEQGRARRSANVWQLHCVDESQVPYSISSYEVYC
jgi:hypothetical protein